MHVGRGNPARYNFGDDPADLGEYAWFAGNSGNQTRPVGQKRPNAFGVFDMPGNVWEWCGDGFDAKSYAQPSMDDPSGPLSSSFRPMRGGCWYDAPPNMRSAYRRGNVPVDLNNFVGFRLARGQSGSR